MLTVVTPSFRQVDLLRLCAASIADQSGPVEHIIQDGGSGRDFEEWSRSQTFATCYSESDKGMYDAINRGFLKSKGDIVSWLNCDEQYLPQTVSLVTEFFSKHPEVDILFGDIIVLNRSFEPICYRKPVKPLPGQIRHRFLPTFSAATFVRQRIIQDGHLLNDSFKTIADAEWIFRLITRGYRTAVLPVPLATFMQTGSNMGQSPAGLEESRRWRAHKGVIGRGIAAGHGALHRVRKVLAGCYRKRHVAIQIHMPGHTERQSVKATIGGTWSEN